MTKTEELMVAFPLIASLISDVHAEGVAEGAEEMKQKIRGLAMPVDNFLHQMSLIIPLSVFNDAPVLAPTKEVAG